jgi:prolyl-tRNA synthetase
MIGALIMVHSDDNGLILPPKIAPRQVAIIPIGTSERVNSIANEIADKLAKAGIVSYVDTTERSPGFKFAEAEVNGIPVRIEIGERDLNENKITFARRDTREKITESLDVDVVTFVKELMDKIQKDMYDRALARQNELTYECKDIEEVKKIMDTKPGFIKAMWCGDQECELKFKEIRGIKSRCILEGHEHIDDKCIICGKPAKELVLWGIQY